MQFTIEHLTYLGATIQKNGKESILTLWRKSSLHIKISMHQSVKRWPIMIVLSEMEQKKNKYNEVYRCHIAFVEKILKKVKSSQSDSSQSDDGLEAIPLLIPTEFYSVSSSVSSRNSYQVKHVEEEKDNKKKKIKAEIKKLDAQILERCYEIDRNTKGMDDEEGFIYRNKFKSNSILPLQQKQEQLEKKLNNIKARKSNSRDHAVLMN